MTAMETITLLKRSYAEWSEHQAPRLGASVAFYSLLSFAPLLILITAVIALVFGQQSAQASLVNEARQLIGDRGAESVQSLLKNAQKPASGTFASMVAFITLLFGASGVFAELQDALNLMWGASLKASGGFLGLVKQRLFSFGMVLSVGFLLLVSLVLSAGLAYLGHAFGELLPVPPFVMEAINFAISFLVITVLFALMFKYVPATKIAWRDVRVGAVGTALLFTVGKLLLGLYLGKASVGSTYGAAGSLVAVIVWIYYSAQIFFFGAEFTHVYAESQSGRLPGAEKSGTQETGPRKAEPDTAPAEPEKMKESAILGTRVIAESTRDMARTPAHSPTTLSLPATVSPSAAAGPRVRRMGTSRKSMSLLMAITAAFVLGRASASASERRSPSRQE